MPASTSTLLTTLDAGAYAGTAALTLGLLATLTARIPPLLNLLPQRTHPRKAADGADAPTRRPARFSISRTGGAVGNPSPAEGRTHPHRPAADNAPAPTPADAPTPPKRLRAHNLTLTHPGGITALDRVTLDLAPSRVTALVGPNGAGKSTLFDCLAGTLRPREG
ncbi:ATP-binding cassette domain-containing protein, partial [Streptomyces massasporeus]